MKFEDILRECGIPIAPPGHEHVRPGWVQFDCPWCSPKWHHYRMGYNETYHFVNCWACGRHKLYATVAELTGLSMGPVSRLLRGLETGPAIQRQERTKLILPKGLEPLSYQHCKYLKRRGYRGEKLHQLVKLWDLKGFTAHSKYPWRIFIPIHFGGRIVSFTTRSLLDDGKRYLAAGAEEEAIDHKSLLYGEDYCRHSIIVVEGPTDTWAIGPGAGATFGTSYSRAQVLRIAAYPLRAVCYDNSPDAQRAANQLCSELECFPGDTYNVVLKDKDPGESGEIKELRSRFLLG